MPAECISMGVPVALGKAMSSGTSVLWSIACEFGTSVDARAGCTAFTLACLDCHTAVIQPGGICWSGHRSSGMSFRVGQSRKDVLYQMHNKARFSVVLVFRIFAEIRSVIRQIHPCTISILPYFSSASCSILLQDRPRYSLHMRFMSINSSTQHGKPNKVSRIPTAEPRFCYARGVVEMEADDTRGNPKNQKDAEVVRIVRSK